MRRGIAVGALLLATLTASDAAAQNILVFGSPGLDSSSNTVTKRFADWGFTATIVDDTEWATLTTDDFAQYDAIYTDGHCDTSFDWSVAMAANQDVWMAAVTGRMYLSMADPEFHTTAGGGTGPDKATENAITWAAGLGSTAAGGATGLVFHSGCPENGSIEIFGNFPSFGTLTSVLGGESEGSGILAAAATHPTMTTPNVLVDGDFSWGSYCHGRFAVGTSPTEYTEAVGCVDGNVGVLLREAIAPDVLVYGPSQSGTGSNSIITGTGAIVTVVDAAGWCAMTTDDFAAFDAIFFDGVWPPPTTQPTTCADLGGTGGTWADIVIETEPVWGPAITGRLYLSVSDSSFHFASAGPTRVIENAVTWATSGGATASGGNTGMVMYTGGLETEVTPVVPILDALSDTLGAFTTGTSDTETDSLLNATHAANTTPNTLTSTDYVWSNYCHGDMIVVPAGYDALSDCVSGNIGTVVRDFAVCGNDVTEAILGEECDGTDIAATCAAGYEGTPLCNNDPANTAGDGTCTFDGDGCTDIDECTDGTDNCTDTADGGVCTNTDGSFSCSCAAGYTGDGTTDGTGCTDIDECTDGTDNCVEDAAGGVCTNEVGGFSCSCTTGYTGDGTTDGTGCTDVDECTDGTDDCVEDAAGGICTNTDGGFTCSCEAGYTGDGTTGGTGCTDADECTDGTDDCDTNASCENTDGGFTCTCNDGFSGDGTTCADVDECADATDTCDANATCENTDGGYTCTCNTGFTGDGETCSEEDPDPDPDPDPDGGEDDGGCSCRVGGRSAPSSAGGLALFGLALVMVRRRRRRD